MRPHARVLCPKYSMTTGSKLNSTEAGLASCSHGRKRGQLKGRPGAPSRASCSLRTSMRNASGPTGIRVAFKFFFESGPVARSRGVNWPAWAERRPASRERPSPSKRQQDAPFMRTPPPEELTTRTVLEPELRNFVRQPEIGPGHGGHSSTRQRGIRYFSPSLRIRWTLDRPFWHPPRSGPIVPHEVPCQRCRSGQH